MPDIQIPADSSGGGDMTAEEILAALLTVDGSGSGLDADLLDGLNSDAFDPAGAAADVQADLVAFIGTLGSAAYVSASAFDLAGAASAVQSNLTTHTSNTSNPHSVTKTQVGLGNADDTSDADKPISTATQTALDLKAPLDSPALTGTPTAPTADPNDNSTLIATTAFVVTGVGNAIIGVYAYVATHIADTANPHAVTKTQVGLGNADNTSDVNKPISTATQTALDLKADLVGGLVPSAQLPSYVDDVLTYANLAAFPATGEAGKIYVTVDTNLTYRWSGSAYVEISASLALGETSATAYRGDRGKTAYDHSQLTTGNPHNVTKTDVGLGNVENTALSTWVGTTNITTLGTIATGTWSGTAIAADKGGTGQTSYSVGDLLYASGTTALSKLADVAVGSYLRSGGVTTAPLWSTLKLPNAGTANYIPFYSSTNTMGESLSFQWNDSTKNLTVGNVAITAAANIIIAGDTNRSITIAPTGTGAIALNPGSNGLTINSGFTTYNTSTNLFQINSVDGTAGIAIGSGAVGSMSGLIMTRDGGVRVQSGGNIQHNIAFSGETVFNEQGLSTLGFRVEGDTNANLIKTDPANDRVGIKIATPAYPLDVNGDFGTAGNLIAYTAGKGLQIKSGTGARAGNATLVAGTVTVTNTTITANTLIMLTRKTAGGVLGNLTYTLSAGASFTINSDNALDTSVVSYHLIEII